MNNKLIKFTLVLLAGLSISACYDGSDDKIEPIVNNRPQAASIDVITQTEVAITDQLSGSDVDGDPITFELDQMPTLGTVTISSTGSYTYQPFDEVTGTDSFTFIVRDSAGLVASATVGITIESLQVSFLSYSRDAFNAEPSAKALAVNGRVFTQDVAGQADYQDLLDGAQ